MHYNSEIRNFPLGLDQMTDPQEVKKVPPKRGEKLAPSMDFVGSDSACASNGKIAIQRDAPHSARCDKHMFFSSIMPLA